MSERTTAELREITGDSIGFFLESDPLSSPEDVRDFLLGALMSLNERVTRLEVGSECLTGRERGDSPTTSARAPEAPPPSPTDQEVLS